MRRRQLLALILAVPVAGCGSSRMMTTSHTTATSALPGVRAAHPQAVEPAAGAVPDAGAGVTASAVASDPVGDPNAHAPSLAEVRRELKQLNLCGGVTDQAQAAPIVSSRAPGFVADPGTVQSAGQLPLLTHQLDLLGKALGVTIYGISGYRSPQHSVAVGGYANDPHTLGEAEDIGVGSLLRSSAASIPEATLARFGLYRPFDPSDDPGNTEVNHVQLIPASGALTLAQAESTFDPDPSCR